MKCTFVTSRHSSSTPLSSVCLMLAASLPLLMLPLLLLPTTTSAYLFDKAALFPSYDYRTKRLSPPPTTTTNADEDCALCFSVDDPESCRRCFEAEPLLPGRERKEEEEDGVLAAAEKRFYEPMRRFQRGSGCSCCYFSRMTNAGCCAACSMTTKRLGKRSGGLVTSDDAGMMLTPAGGSGRRRDYVVDAVNCRCCSLTGDEGCCGGCLFL